MDTTTCSTCKKSQELPEFQDETKAGKLLTRKTCATCRAAKKHKRDIKKNNPCQPIDNLPLPVDENTQPGSFLEHKEHYDHLDDSALIEAVIMRMEANEEFKISLLKQVPVMK